MIGIMSQVLISYQLFGGEKALFYLATKVLKLLK